MSEPNPANPARPADEGLSFVERETRRRKRLLRFYLAMLAVPLLLAAAVLLFGRSDRQMVREELKTQAPAVVRQVAGDQFAPAIQTEVQNQITPTITQINELKTSQAAIAEEVKTLSASNAKLTPEDVETIRQSGERFARQETAIKELQTQTAAISSQLRNLSDIQGKLDRLEGQVKALALRIDRRATAETNQGTKDRGKP